MDMKQIKTLMKDFDESGLSKMKVTKDDFTIEVEKNVAAPVVQATPVVAAPVATAPVTQASAPAAVEALSGDAILSPMVGTFYSSPSPEASAFVKVGDNIKKGQVLAILEAMKIMNEIEAEFDCIIKEVLVSDGQAIEYDMPLFAVEKI